jgi:hypothetical protein
MDRRGKGDLRAVSLSQRDLASRACEQENLRPVTPQSPANKGGAAAVLLSSPSPSSSAAPTATTGKVPHNNITPVANEGRARAKQDMTDVYVCFAFFFLFFVFRDCLSSPNSSG